MSQVFNHFLRWTLQLLKSPGKFLYLLTFNGNQNNDMYHDIPYLEYQYYIQSLKNIYNLKFFLFAEIVATGYIYFC